MSIDPSVLRAARKMIPGTQVGGWAAQPVVRALLDRGPQANDTPVTDAICIPLIGTWSDDFNKADGALGPGIAWEELFPGSIPMPVVRSSQADCDFPGSPCVDGGWSGARAPATLRPHQVVQITISTCNPTVTPNTAMRVDVLARLSDFDAFGIPQSRYNAAILNPANPGNGDLFLQKQVSGVPSTIDGLTGQTYGAGDVLSLEVDGTSLTVKVNGVTKLTATDSDVPGECSKAGFEMINGCSGGYGPTGNGDFLLDDFSVVASV